MYDNSCTNGFNTRVTYASGYNDSLVNSQDTLFVSGNKYKNNDNKDFDGNYYIDY